MAKSGIEIQLVAVIDELNERIARDADTVIALVAKEAVKKLKSTGPKKTGDYARGWSVKKDSQGGQIVYNKSKPYLTQLLENGHVIRNKKGEYGRAPAHVHIKPVADWAETELQQRIMRELNL